MKQILPFILAILVTGCNQSTPASGKLAPQADSLTVSATSDKLIYAQLLGKCKEITLDTLEVFATAGTEDSTYPYRGTPLDSLEVGALFPGERNPFSSVDHPPEFFAVSRFAMDAVNTGFIVRTPSEYTPTSIKLFVYNRLSGTIHDHIELADTWGDAGDAQITTSWLFKTKEQKIRMFTWVEMIHDNSVDNDADTTVIKSNQYCLLDLTRSLKDTVSADEKVLLKDFGHLLIAPAVKTFGNIE